jgi:hypothetical protein
MKKKTIATLFILATVLIVAITLLLVPNPQTTHVYRVAASTTIQQPITGMGR